MSYGYDPNGNLTGKTTTGFAGATANAYGYDQAGRLTSWNNGTTSTGYGYDAAGNLTKDGAKTYSYDVRDELTSDGVNSYSYTASGTLASEATATGAVSFTADAYGNEVTQGARSYLYDALGRDVQAWGGGAGTAALTYRATSWQVTSDGMSTYTWAPDGTLAATGVAGGTQAQGVLDFTDSHTDVTGQFTAAATALAGSADYDPWGTVTATSGTRSGSLGFQSQYADPVTGKTEMGARWYDPATGGFTSADTVIVPPFPDPAAANPFAYAGDNPLDATDPTRHTERPDIPIPAMFDTGVGPGEDYWAGGGYTAFGDASPIDAGAAELSGVWEKVAKALEAAAAAVSAAYGLYELAGAGGSGAQGAGGRPALVTCAGAPDGYWGGCGATATTHTSIYGGGNPSNARDRNTGNGGHPVIVNDGTDSGGGSPLPWWASYKHPAVHYKNDKAPAGNTRPFSRAAVAAAIRAIARSLTVTPPGNGGSGGTRPPTANGGACEPTPGDGEEPATEASTPTQATPNQAANPAAQCTPAAAEDGTVVGRYGDMPRPRPGGFEAHHGVNSVWAKANVEGYSPADVGDSGRSVRANARRPVAQRNARCIQRVAIGDRSPTRHDCQRNRLDGRVARLRMATGRGAVRRCANTGFSRR